MTTSPVSNHHSDILRRPIQANIAFSGLSVLVLLILGGELTHRLDFDPTWFLRGLGLILVPWLGVLYLVVCQQTMQRLHVLGIALADSAWVVVSLTALLLDVFSLNTAGQWAVLAVSDLVGILAVWEFVVLWKTQS